MWRTGLIGLCLRWQSLEREGRWKQHSFGLGGLEFFSSQFVVEWIAVTFIANDRKNA